MGCEIERKYLVRTDSWRDGPAGRLLRQGYLSRDPKRTIRIRISGDEAFLTIKSAREGIRRDEFEYAVPVEDATELLALCEGPLVEKIRHEREFGGHLWEIDEFLGANAGLVVAEIELEAADEDFPLPGWAGEEVSDDPRYYNSNLAVRPWSSW